MAVSQGIADRLYYDTPMLEFTARVTDIRLVATERNAAGDRAQLWQVALERTAFYPESGGQPWDTGVLVATARSGATLEVPVERVEEDAAGEVWHFVRKPLVEGTEVRGQVDAERRRDHMQQHSGQHLLSAVFLKQLGARTVSFHLGAESSTIDLALPEGKAGLTEDELESVEAEVNRLVFADRPLMSCWHSREEAERMLASGHLRKLPERAGPLRVVEMQGVEFNACGGTHVAATGAIGGLSLRRLEKVKQGWRVEFVCGLRAVRAARQDFVLLGGIAASLSVGAADVSARVAALLEESKAAAKQIRGLKEANARCLALEMVQEGAVVCPIFHDGDMEYAKTVARECVRLGSRAFVTTQGETETGVVLARSPEDTFHAGDLVRGVLSQTGARGGGSAELGQGRGTNEQMRHVGQQIAAELARQSAAAGQVNADSLRE